MALEVTDPVDRALKASDEAMAACDRANDHTDDDAGRALDAMCKARQDDLHHHQHQNGWRAPNAKLSNIDEPWVWPKSEAGREGRLHRCSDCKEAKPYSEFTRMPHSRIFTGRKCNKCIDDRRTTNVSRQSSVGAAAAGPGTE
jgi:hypothetical protein